MTGSPLCLSRGPNALFALSVCLGAGCGQGPGAADSVQIADASEMTAPDAGLDATDAPTTDDGVPAPDPTAFAFLVYGDSRAGSDCAGNANHIRLVSRMAAEPDVAFVAHVGDMVTGYADTTCFAAMGACTDPASHGNFRRIIAPLADRPAPAGLPAAFLPVIGNHDDNGGWYPDPCGGGICDAFDLAALIDHPTPNRDPCGLDYPDSAYYGVRYGNTQLLVLHVNYDYFDFFECNYPPAGWASCADYCENGPRDALRAETCWNVHQYDWLEARLVTAAGDPSIRHKVVLLHAPIYTSYDDHPPVAAAGALAALFDRYGVNFVFNGHNHTYERTVPIRAGAAASGGTVYVTTAGGGVDGYSPAGGWFTAAAAFAFHYVRLTVDGASPIRGQTIDIDGNVIDTF